MSLKNLVQLMFAILLILFSTSATWYEGSAILDNPWEWKYTALFSQWIHGEVQHHSDISQLDFFIYAAKFKPAYPLMMFISGFYLIIVLGYVIIGNYHKKLAIFLGSIGALLFLLGSIIASSPTIGGNLFTVVFMLVASICIFTALTLYFQWYKRIKVRVFSTK
ncbi:hypothetical protein JOC86_002943 [Bacillus pakistanensis]|uniref:DUF4306 domain-containing protein n=1 Tax=Rossellomorea pakistanensis TaxID=992288 RepID=A0ABS2NFQ0_9BACI|nr:YjdJ family protein [Bacillus pakistanensis]MBM7586391.1 hypothetical protein [Bacillus pakistanensis]